MTPSQELLATATGLSARLLESEERHAAHPAGHVRQLDRAAAHRGRTAPDRIAADGLGVGHRPGRRVLGHRSPHVALVGGTAPPPADLRARPGGGARRAGARLPHRGRRGDAGQPHRGAPVPRRTDRRRSHLGGRSGDPGAARRHRRPDRPRCRRTCRGLAGPRAPDQHGRQPAGRRLGGHPVRRDAAHVGGHRRGAGGGCTRGAGRPVRHCGRGRRARFHAGRGKCCAPIPSSPTAS